MIGFLRGKVIATFKTGKSTASLVLWPYESLTQLGVGYTVVVSEQLVQSFAGDTVVELWLYTVQTDKESYVIGLESIEAMKTFLDLLTVSGVGPKTALGVLGSLGVEGVRQAILAKDLKGLGKVPGLGAKTAAKIMIELGGKDGYAAAIATTKSTTKEVNARYAPVLATLQRLGYSSQQAKEAVERATSSLEKIPEENVAEMVKIVLGYVT